MRKTILYLVILGILGFGIYYFLFKDQAKVFNTAESTFSIADTANVGKIFIAESNGAGMLVERTDSGWMVNKQYKALPSMVNLILNTITKQVTLYPVTKAAFDNVIKVLSTDSKKVEIYGRDGKKIKTFYVGGASVSGNGTNMMVEGASTPYVVQTPGFNGYLTARYSTQLTDWRDRTVFNIPDEEIKSVSVQYKDKPVNSFVMTRENGGIVVTGDPEITKHLDPQNNRRVNVYLKYFTNINCEGIMNGIPHMDSIIHASPQQSAIDITGMHGQHLHADIYWMALNKRSKNINSSNPDVPDDYDADRLYAVINNSKDTVMIQQFVFKKIFRKAFEFFQNDKAGNPAAASYEQPKNVMIHKDH